MGYVPKYLPSLKDAGWKERACRRYGSEGKIEAGKLEKSPKPKTAYLARKYATNMVKFEVTVLYFMICSLTIITSRRST